MNSVENTPKKVKLYVLREPIHVDSQTKRDSILGDYSDTVFACKDAGVTPPPPPVVGFPPEKKTLKQCLGHSIDIFSQKFYVCGDIWEHYEFFDEQGRPLSFKAGYTLPKETKAIEEIVEDAIEQAERQELENEIQACLDKLDEIEKTPMTEDEKRAERERYIRKVKKTIRRLINGNRLYYMYTLTFALEENKNVNGLRFILPEDDQRDREQVLDVWNTRLTDIRRWLTQKYHRDFKFVLVLERHDSENTDPRKRGTYHLHLATDKPLDKHELQQHWGYGVVWVDDFKKTKIWDKTLQKYVNVDTGFINDPGRYMADYLEKEIDNPEFLNKHAYSSSRGNLRRPKQNCIRDDESITRILENPSLAFQRGEIPESVYQKILRLKNIEEVETYDTLKANNGKPYEVDTPIGKVYVRYRVFNFRLLYPQAQKMQLAA